MHVEAGPDQQTAEYRTRTVLGRVYAACAAVLHTVHPLQVVLASYCLVVAWPPYLPLREKLIFIISIFRHHMPVIGITKQKPPHLLRRFLDILSNF